MSIVIPERYLEEAREMAKSQAIRALKAVGEECVDEAVQSGNYTDQTCNLRSSIGFVVADDGRVVEEGGFWNLGGSEGPTIGRAKAYEKASDSSGLALIIVAGMDYAEYVADKGFNVLDSAELLASQLISQLGNAG